MPTIKISLNVQSIENAINELNNYKYKVECSADELVKRLVESGIEIARFNVQDMNAYDSGDLYNSIHGEFDDEIGFVVADSGHAAFVEFGTGVVGRDSPHPNIAVAGWRYDVNEHGELGWWYPGKDGKYHWTKGMPHRPYMYVTAKELREIYASVARKLLQDGGDAI